LWSEPLSVETYREGGVLRIISTRELIDLTKKGILEQKSKGCGSHFIIK